MAGGLSKNQDRGVRQGTDRQDAETDPLFYRFINGGNMTQHDAMLLAVGWILVSILVCVLTALTIEHVCGRG